MPKMAGRTSARSSASRDQATSPPKQSNKPQSQSPRRTRSGRSRSQSVDLGGDDRETNQKLPGKRTLRQGSAESADSNASAASSRGGGHTRKPTRATNRNLPTVAEDHEEEEEEEDQADVDGHGDDSDSSEIEDLPSGERRIRSPSSASQMSGTTAYSAATSYSAKELASINPMAAEALPELYTISRHILDLLAPPNASKDQIESIVKDLKKPGSRRATRLKEEEDNFKGVRELYGTDIDTYIQMRFISRKLLGSQAPNEGLFRPDAVIHTANIAAMVKEFLVFEQGSPTIREALMRLENFPEPFLRSFDESLQYGSSALFHSSFEMALDIRTQFTINALRHAREQEDFNPDELLTTQFFDEPTEENQELDSFDDILMNGRPKGLPGGPAVSKDQVAMIKERVTEIRSTFRDNEDAQEAGDLVDFEQLEEMFPWPEFLTQLLNWSRERLAETSQSIEKQGGLETVTKELMQFIQKNNSQAEISHEIPHETAPAAPKPPQLAPAAEIPQPSLNTTEMVRFIQKLKRGPSSARPLSSKAQAKKAEKNAQSSAPNPGTFSDFMLPDIGGEDDDDILPRHSSKRPTASYSSIIDGYGNERNKENRPGTQASSHQAGVKELRKRAKAGTRDHQANAGKMQWSAQESMAGPSTQKRSHQHIDEEEPSEDEGFEGDKRVPDLSRRRGLPPARQYAPDEGNPRPSKRARANTKDGDEATAPGKSHGRSRAVHQEGPRHLDEDDEEEEEEEEEEGASPPPTFRQINRVALSQSAKARSQTFSKTQKRVPWSDEDVQYLTEGIEEYGCKWSLLWKLNGWEVQRDQVALKDKARNLKVSYLKSSVPLPTNFDNIALGKKEIEAIQKVRPDWEPEH